MIARQLAVKTLPGPVKISLLRTQKHALEAVIKYRELTGGLGALPSFLIIGGQKCGTTYLYDRLQEHPSVCGALKKEIDFFQVHYAKGFDWYRGHFAPPERLSSPDGGRRSTGEASGYISFRDAPARIAEVMPDVKLIALLRNPVDRAYSHFQHVRRLGIEQVPSLEEALDLDRQGDGGRYYYRRRTYLEKGIYADQLVWWFDAFPREQVLIMQSEEFYRSPTAALKSIARFLELPEWEPAEYQGHKQFSYSRLSVDVRAPLEEYYRPHNERLFDMLGVDFGWNE